MKKTNFLFLLLAFTIQTATANFALAQTTGLLTEEESKPQIETATEAPTETEEQLAALYNAEALKNSGNLERQCKFSSLEEMKAAQTNPDPELQMSAADYAVHFQAATGASPTNFSFGTPDSADNCFMNSNEMAALRAYTGSWYSTLNLALRSKDKATLVQQRVAIKFLISALSKLKDFVGYVKRGTNLKADGLALLQVSHLINYPQFSSTSIKTGFGGNTRYVIYSRSCKYLAPFSVFMSEEEVLCMPGTVFLVRWKNETAGNTKILMEEKSQSFDIDQYIQSIP